MPQNHMTAFMSWQLNDAPIVNHRASERIHVSA